MKRGNYIKSKTCLFVKLTEFSTVQTASHNALKRAYAMFQYKFMVLAEGIILRLRGKAGGMFIYSLVGYSGMSH